MSGDTPDGDDGQPEVPDPFAALAGLPMFGDLARALSGQGPINWDAARQFAHLAANPEGSAPEGNVDPTVRIALANLGRIVDMHVRDLTGYEGTFPELTPVTPTMWAQRTLEAYRPLFTELATSLGRRDTGLAEAGDDPFAAMMANLSSMMAPSMMGMAVGSMVGRMASGAFGQYDLPIPRQDETLLVVPSSIDRFAADWSLPVDEMRLWVLAQELTGHVLFSLGTVRDEVTALVRQHVGGFRPDPEALMEHLGNMGGDDSDDPMQAMQQAFSDPALLLGAVQSPEQAALAPRLQAAIAAIVGYVDTIVDGAAVRLVGGEALRIAEAVRRRRIEQSPHDQFVERLLGLSLDHEQVQRGKLFVGGVIDRIGEARLSEAYALPGSLPTPAELDAPGLWLARLGLD
jgi:putative hydrolase